MGDNLDGFVDYLKKTKGLSDKTIYHYLTYHRHFCDQPFTQETINLFVQSKNNNKVCRGYIKSYIEFMKKGKEFELPILKSGSKKKRLIRPVSKIEINKIRDYAYLKKRSDGVIFDLLYYGALRRGELKTIRINSFNWATWFADPSQFCEFKVIGKGDKERSVVVPPKAVQMILQAYFDKGILTNYMTAGDVLEKLNAMDNLIFSKASEWVIWKLVKKYSIKALNRDIRTHEIRHARATELEENNASIRDIQRYLGHSNLATTEIYLHSDEGKSLERIKELSLKTL